MKYNYSIKPSKWDPPFVVKTNPKPDEVWYIKICKNPALVKATVTDVTTNTVEVLVQYGFRTRYSRSDIEFVERVNYENL